MRYRSGCGNRTVNYKYSVALSYINNRGNLRLATMDVQAIDSIEAELKASYILKHKSPGARGVTLVYAKCMEEDRCDLWRKVEVIEKEKTR